jgi:protein-S-isoprenylcysteine O-methyltransferase Ste14
MDALKVNATWTEGPISPSPLPAGEGKGEGCPNLAPHGKWSAPALDHLIPAGLWLVQLLAKITALILYLDASANSPTSAVAAYVVQQTLTCAFIALNVVFFLTRSPVLGARSSCRGRVIALAGTFVLFIPISRPAVKDQPELLIASSAIILVGTVLSIVSIMTLGRCFGLFPEARGLVTRGPYRFVRHPLYLGEIITATGVVVGTASPALAGLLVLLLIAFQYWRATLEERALTRVFPDYATYQRQTWRIVPGIH